MPSGNAKRRKAQQHQAQRHADKSHRRDRSESHDHLPKVGTGPEQEHLRKQRRADLLDFGRIKAGRVLPVVLAVLAILAVICFMIVFT